MRFVAFWIGLCLSGAAHAEQSDLGQAEELAHRVRARFDRGLVHLTVEREIVSRSEQPELVLFAALPPEAVVTGVRMKAGSAWQRGRMLPIETAEKLYVSGVRPARSSSKRGLVAWVNLGLIAVKTYPVKTGETLTLEYTMTAAPCYANGHYRVAYPAAADVKPQFVGSFAVTAPSDPDWDGIGQACEQQGYLPTVDAAVWLTLGRDMSNGIRSTFGRFGLDGGRELFRLEVDAGQVLEPAPRRAHVVFAVDTSFSMGARGVAAQLDLVAGYLKELPDARYEIVAYNRYPQRVFGQFADAERAQGWLAETEHWSLGNGSNLDSALALAGSLAAQQSGPGRIILFTDGRFRKTLEADLARVKVDLGRAVLHVVDVAVGESDRYLLMRREQGMFSELAGRSGGMFVQVSGTPGSNTAQEAIRGLVRPIQVDQLRLRVGGKEQRIIADREDVLREGQAVRYFTMVDAPVTQVELVGKIWGRSWSQPVRRDAALSEALPALVFGDPLWESLDMDEQARAARASGVISPVTAWVLSPDSAPEGRLSAWGMSRNGSGLFGNVIGCPTLAFQRDGDGIGAPLNDAIQKLLRPQVAMCAAHHGLDHYEAELYIEATGNEIVEVLVSAASPEFAACVREAAWRFELDATMFGGGGSGQITFVVRN